MYSTLKNHSNNLQYCQRFYYNAYEYYNDYQKPQDYEDDLSKLFFKCKRKTIATIWGHNNPTNQPFFQNRQIRINKLQPTQSQQQIISNKITYTTIRSSQMLIENQQNTNNQSQNMITMQTFLNQFIQIYNQNNFSDFKNDLQQNKNKHKIILFPQQKILKIKSSSQKNKNFNIQIDFIQNLFDSFNAKIKQIKKLYEQQNIDVDDMSYYSYQLAFQALNSYQIDCLLKNKQQGYKVINSLNLFKNMIQNILDQICDSQSWSHLILYIPKLPILNYYFNPLVSGIYTFLRKQQSLSKSDYHKTQQVQRQVPKIVLINLDSRQSAQNIRAVNSCSSAGLMYITIYNQTIHHQQIQDQQQQIADMLSKLLVKQIYQANRLCTQDKKNKGKNNVEVPKVFAFPLNSKYIKKQLKQKYNNQINFNCTLNGSSQDIMFLFDNVLFQQIRNFSPNIIMISYNGTLNINQEHFSKIIRTLTIISDHRIVLFPNLSNLYQTQNQQSLQVPTQQFIEQKGVDEQAILKTKSYLQKYHQIDLAQIDLHNFYNNLALFLKISSGTYSFQDRHYSHTAIFQKYETGLKYQYLQRLAELQQFKYYSKFTSKHLKGTSLMKLMQRQRKQCLQKNIDNISLYKSLIDQAVDQIWSQSQKIPKNIKYKVKKISRALDDRQDKLQQYFNLKKDRLLIQTIRSQKIKKAYYVKGATRQNQTDNLYVYTFRQNSQERQQILLQTYSQVIFQQYGDKFLNIFVINVRDEQDRLKIMFGQTKLIGYEVYLSPVRNITQQNISKKMQSMTLENDQQSHIEYVNYSYTFYKSQLYLFWPYEWNLKLQAQSVMTGCQYNPKIVNRMLRINLQFKDKRLIIFAETLNYIPKYQLIPRLFTGSWAETSQKIFVFGGIFDNTKDFQIIDSGVCIIKIEDNKFWVEPIPKVLNRSKIRPKINYVVQKIDNQILLISAGHGRQFTNFFNIFSYHSYEFNLKTYDITMKKGNRKVIHLPKPMFTRKQGRFDMAKDKGALSNLVKIQQRVSHQPKYKFILCRKGFYSQKDGNKNSAITFLDDDYTTTVYNKQTGFGHIFTTNGTFQNIYSQRYCSPQIYVWDKSRDLIRIQILVQVSKQVNEYAMKQFIFPNQDSLISFCIHSSHQKIYLLTRSAIYTRNLYILYEGVIKNSELIAQQKQLRMKIFFQFKPNIIKLQEKAMYSQDHRLMICGGNINGNGFRQDYLIERIKGKYKLKTIRLSYPISPFVVQMQNPYILQTLQDKFLMYTIALNHEQKWMIKIQQFSLSSNKRIIKQSQISLNTICQGKYYRIAPNITKLNFLNISRYSRFSFDYLKGKSHALLIQMNKYQQDNDFSQIQQQIRTKVLKFILQNSYQQIQQKITQIYNEFKRFILYILKQKYDDAFYVEKSAIIWQILLILVNYQIEQGFYASLTEQQKKNMDKLDMYRFLIQDKSRPLTKYVAISHLGTTKINFFQIKTRKPIVSSMVSTIGGQDQYGININQKNCNQIYFDDYVNYQNDILYQRKNQWENIHVFQYQIVSEYIKGQ